LRTACAAWRRKGGACGRTVEWATNKSGPGEETRKEVQLPGNPSGYRTFLRFCVLFTLILPGCSPQYWKQNADAEVYAIIREKEKRVFGEARPFSLEQYQGRPEPKPEVLHLTLRKALQIAAKHSRSFQTQRETLYLTALTLTGDRNEYRPLFMAALRGAISGDKDNGTASGTAEVGFDKAWKWGLGSAVRFSSSILRAFTTAATESVNSALTASITQPLLRGFGAKIAAENLTQSERNVIYAVRSFERFRREFAVQITSTYLRTLQQYDELENARANLKSTRTNYERIKAQAEAGRLPLFQLDQARTDLLSAQDRLNVAQNNLKDSLDRLKLTLGLPLDQEIELDASELSRLKATPVDELGVDLEGAVEIALACRLDLANERDKVEDARRAVMIAADQLRAQLDLTGEITVPNQDDKPFKLKTEKFRYTAGLNLDLPVERTRERNLYRSALISLDRQKRNLEQFEDQIRLDVASAYRALERALRSYQIQLESRKVAATRVASTQELLKWGRVETRDLLEALSAELRAKNSVTAALIDYRIAYLEFLLALGVLEVDPDGVFVDVAVEGGNEEPKRQS